MKAAILGDVHIGARLNSPHYANYLERFFREEFFPYLDLHGIKTVIQVGDLFDRKSEVALPSLYRAKETIFSEMEKRGIRFICLVGNHDMATKDSVVVNASTLLLKEYFEFELIDKPRSLEFDGIVVDVIPWICKDNAREIHTFMKNSKSDILFAHLQLTGFQMDGFAVCKEGLDRAAFKRYDVVVSGHFHHRSDDGHIFYIGSPTQITWADFEDPRGFTVFDFNTRKQEFIQSKLKFFHKVVYDDVGELEAMKNMDFEQFKGTYVKLLVISKSNPVLFDKVKEGINNVGPADLKVMDDVVVEMESDEDTVEVEVENTLKLLDAYVDEVVTDVDPGKLKSLFHELYVEAQTDI